ncbi:MAG: hypothetical protein JWM40_3082 [Frankiales bacterium]|nr:hypothetical protein [Frankiales bacterium]
MASWQHRAIVRVPTAPRVDLTGKTVVVTGAADGSIGGETARILSAWGADVTITTRSRRPTLTGVDWHPLDLTDRQSVKDFAAWYDRDRLDVLVNNGGVHLDLMGSWKEPHRDAEGHELHWRTNYLGTMHLTDLLLPRLERSEDARIVNVVSKLHTRGTNAELFEGQAKYSSWTAYGLSKLALVHATKEQQTRYAPGGVQSFALHPGEVYTDIATKGLAEHRAVGAIRKALKPVEAFFLMTAEEGAQTSVYVASQPGLQGGRYFAKCAEKEPSPEVADSAAAARLWDQTQSWVRAQ